MPALEVPFSPGNPAAISCDVEELGQWFCVPAFRLGCLYQAMVINNRVFVSDSTISYPCSLSPWYSCRLFDIKKNDKNHM